MNPSVATSPPLLLRRCAAPEMLVQRRGHDPRQRLLGVDRVVLHPPDQVDRQVHVELLELVASLVPSHDGNSRLLATYCQSAPTHARRWRGRSPATFIAARVRRG